MSQWRILAKRVDAIADQASVRPTPVDDAALARLTVDQLEQAARLRARIDAVGEAGLTADELRKCAILRAALDVETTR